MIRKAKKSDSKIIAKLLSALGDEIFTLTGAKINTDKKLIETLFQKSFNKKLKAYVYEIDKKVVGFITYSDCFSLYAKGSFYIVTELYVKNSYRSKKIGKKLLNKVMDKAKKNNKTRIEVTTPPLPYFQKSLEFYLKNGFEVTGGKKVKYEL